MNPMPKRGYAKSSTVGGERLLRVPGGWATEDGWRIERDEHDDILPWQLIGPRGEFFRCMSRKDALRTIAAKRAAGAPA
jgi:hypothetical protein